MQSEELIELGVGDALEAMAAGRTSSVELTQALLARMDALQPSLNALTWYDAEDALAQAREADEQRKCFRVLAHEEGGKIPNKPLLGVPIAIKDLLNVKGQPCTAGSNILKGYVSPYDATVIARLRAAGAVLVSRANTDEFAMGGSTETSAYGPSKNPWDTARVPGGSSGGSAVAVAARLAPAALGSDTGGSIRQPASFCGITGLKPTYGRVSRYGCTAFASSLDQVGPMARTVEDAARVYAVIAGADPHDSTTSASPVGDPVGAAREGASRGSLAGLKLGLPKEYFSSGLDPEVETAVQAAVEECRRLGAETVEVSLPHSRFGIACYYILAPAEASANLARYDGVRYGARAVDAEDLAAVYERTRSRGFGAEVKRRVILGTYVLGSGFYDAYYSRAQKVRTLIRRDFEEAFASCDALLGPVAPTPAFRLGERTADPLQMYLGDIFTVNVNLAGVCAMSVPCGFTAAGLPVGLHIVGPAYGEERILSLAAAYQRATDWHLRRPPDPV